MSSGMFQSWRNSIVSCFSSLTFEIVKTKVCKMYCFIFAVFLTFYYYYRRFGCIIQTLSTLYQRQVSRITNSVSFRLLRSYILSFFRLTILMTTASLLASGLYYSLYDDSKAAMLSFLGVAASVLTRLIFQGDTNSAVLKFLWLVAFLLLGTGLLLLSIPRLWTTAFYSVCVGTIVHKIIFEVQEMTLLTISDCIMAKVRKQIKEYLKSSSVQIVHYDSYLEHYNFETGNEKIDETKLSGCEMSCYSAASSAENRDEVNSCDATIFSARDQDSLVQQASPFENRVPVKVSNVEKAVEQFNTSDNSHSVSSFDACIAPPRKRYLRKLGKNEDPAAIKTEESSVLNDDMTSIYWKDTKQNIHQSVESGNVCGESINDNTSSEDTSLKTTVYTNSTTSIYSKESKQNIHQRVELGSLCNRSIDEIASFENIYREALPHTNSGAEINFPILKIHKDNDFVEQTCFLEDSGEVPIRRISNFYEIMTGISNYSSQGAFSKNEYIAHSKKRYLKYIHEEKDHAIQIKFEELPSLSTSPIHANRELEQGLGEWIKPRNAFEDASKFNRSSDITQQSEDQASGMYRCSSVSNIDKAKDMSISGDDFEELRNSTSGKNISMSFTHDQGILDCKDEVPVNNLNSDEATKQCSDCKAQYHAMSKHECFVSHKKRILRKYSDEENFAACKSEMLTKYKSEETTIPEPESSLETTVNADLQPALTRKDNDSVNLQLTDDLAEAGRSKSNTRVSEEVSITRETVVQLKSNVDDVVNQIDGRFIYALL